MSFLDILFHLITKIVLGIFLVATLYGVFGNDVTWGSEAFAILLLAVAAYGGGAVMAIFKLPPLIGMLMVGILYRNLHFITFSKDISTRWATTLRDISLVIILLKAGLGLDANKLKILKLVVFKLSFIPCLVETASSVLFSHYLLGLPWLWSVMLGFIISAVSAAILVPGALSLEEKGLGSLKGVPTLLLAGVSLDNITALTGFIVVFNIITSNENLTWTVFRRLLEPCGGLLLGTLLGVLLWYFPKKNPNHVLTVTCYRAVLMCSGGMALVFVSKRLGVPGIGALGCVSLAFTAALDWTKDPDQFKTISWVTGALWQIIEPFLFGLIGAEVTIESLQNNIGYGTLVLLLEVLVRVLFTIVALQGSNLNLKEKVFVAASWLSKATVQAAVGSQALDYGRTEHKGEEFEKLGNQVLTMSVLSIVLTAPLGALLMDLLGPRLLKEEKCDVQQSEQNDVFVRENNNYGSCPRDFTTQKRFNENLNRNLDLPFNTS